MPHSLSSHDDPAALLAWYVAMGVDEAHGDEPINRFTQSSNPESAQAKPPPQNTNKVMPKPVPAQPAAQASYETALEKAIETAGSCKTINDLKHALETFEGCSLKNTATHTVIADGIEGAPLMVISAAPSADEDRTGIAFQGVGGQLLDKMIAAIGYSRETNAYLAHIVPWRPLGNRNPDQQSLILCMPFIKKHIELAQPKAILMLGNATAQNLTSSDVMIARLRGKWQTLSLNGHEIAAMPTYHPEYLLKHPRYKKDSWQDLLALKEKLESP